MRNRMIALLAGLMVLGIAGTALAAPNVDRLVDLDLSYEEAKLAYTVYEDGTGLFDEVVIDVPVEYMINHGQLLKLWKSSLKEELAAIEWEGGWGCLISAFAGTDIGKKGDDGTAGDFEELINTKCKKKAEDWEPPGKAKKGADWQPPGQAKKNTP